MPGSLRAAYDESFANIREDVLRLTEMVDQAIDLAWQSLRERDQELAQQIIEDDEKVNDQRFDIEEACLKLIATQQPTATDLRAVIAAMNVVVDLERMGDYAAGIAKTVIRMGDEALLKPLVDIPRMVEISRDMLQEALRAYSDRDPALAREVAARDDEIDRLYKSIFDELVEIMAENPEGVTRATYLLWVAHNLERIGDRVTNIAERVVFVTTGDMKELND